MNASNPALLTRNALINADFLKPSNQESAVSIAHLADDQRSFSRVLRSHVDAEQDRRDILQVRADKQDASVDRHADTARVDSSHNASAAKTDRAPPADRSSGADAEQRSDDAASAANNASGHAAANSADDSSAVPAEQNAGVSKAKRDSATGAVSTADAVQENVQDAVSPAVDSEATTVIAPSSETVTETKHKKAHQDDSEVLDGIATLPSTFAVSDEKIADTQVVMPAWIEKSLSDLSQAFASVTASADSKTETLATSVSASLDKSLSSWLLHADAQSQLTAESKTGMAANTALPAASASTTGFAAVVSALAAGVVQQKSQEVGALSTALYDATASQDAVVAAQGGGVPGNVLPASGVLRSEMLSPQQALAQAGVMAEKMAAQIVWMQSQHIQHAEMRLSPVELGQVQIQMDIQRDQATVAVSSPHAHVRDWLNAGQLRLHDLLGQTGLELASYSVSDSLSQQASQQSRQHAQGETSRDSAGNLFGDRDGVESAGENGESASPMRVGIGLVDSYA